ncbi:unnamed protein product [Cuscuta epithymum]|uniref:Uncharacterized protein n=1 Tax=Cuscuta epithymum TaxID=186058 RepID=A0AAV0F056_9ASTE|nr:unnamed protein product [Cuscuta epithymum]
MSSGGAAAPAADPAVGDELLRYRRSFSTDRDAKIVTLQRVPSGAAGRLRSSMPAGAAPATSKNRSGKNPSLDFPEPFVFSFFFLLLKPVHLVSIFFFFC